MNYNIWFKTLKCKKSEKYEYFIIAKEAYGKREKEYFPDCIHVH